MKKLLEIIDKEINQIRKEKVLQKCLKVLDLEDENRFVSFDFSEVFDLLEDVDLDVIKRGIEEIRQVIQINIAVGSKIPFSTSQLNAIEEFKKSIQSTLKNSDYSVSITDLEDLKDLLLGKYKKDCNYEEILRSLLLSKKDSLSVEDIEEMYQSDLLVHENGRVRPEWNDVVALFQDFFGDEYTKILNTYKEEILNNIELDEARKVLQFFRDKDVLSKFKKKTILKICVFGDSEYVKKIYQEHGVLDLYYKDIASSLWICSSSSRRNGSFGVNREKTDEEKEKSLLAQSYVVTDEEFWQNADFLKEHAFVFSDKYRSMIDNLIENLKKKDSDKSPEEIEKMDSILVLLMKAPWLLQKNMALFQTFQIEDVPVSSLGIGDVEDKIHLAIELGLLHPPVNYELEEAIYTSEVFKEQNPGKSIRDYFSRYATSISVLNVNDYAYYKYALNILGYDIFYNYFFSEKRIGQRNQTNYEEDIKRMVNAIADKDSFIKEHFVSLKDCVNNYDEYDEVLAEIDSVTDEYCDKEILEDEFIKKLEENFTVMDLTDKGEKKNEFIYQIGNTYISRYKVLHNASLLKKKYGTLTDDMIIMAVVRNSFLSKGEFSCIQDEVSKALSSEKSIVNG